MRLLFALEPRSVAASIFFVIFNATVLLLVSAYTANLASFSTVKIVAKEGITSIASLARQDKAACAAGSNNFFVAENYPQTHLC